MPRSMSSLFSKKLYSRALRDVSSFSQCLWCGAMEAFLGKQACKQHPGSVPCVRQNATRHGEYVRVGSGSDKIKLFPEYILRK